MLVLVCLHQLTGFIRDRNGNSDSSSDESESCSQASDREDEVRSGRAVLDSFVKNKLVLVDSRGKSCENLKVLYIVFLFLLIEITCGVYMTLTGMILPFDCLAMAVK